MCYAFCRQPRIYLIFHFFGWLAARLTSTHLRISWIIHENVCGALKGFSCLCHCGSVKPISNPWIMNSINRICLRCCAEALEIVAIHYTKMYLIMTLLHWHGEVGNGKLVDRLKWNEDRMARRLEDGVKGCVINHCVSMKAKSSHNSSIKRRKKRDQALSLARERHWAGEKWWTHGVQVKLNLRLCSRNCITIQWMSFFYYCAIPRRVQLAISKLIPNVLISFGYKVNVNKPNPCRGVGLMKGKHWKIYLWLACMHTYLTANSKSTDRVRIEWFKRRVFFSRCETTLKKSLCTQFVVEEERKWAVDMARLRRCDDDYENQWNIFFLLTTMANENQ